MEENNISAYENAINYFSKLNGYKDSVQLMTECDRKISELKTNDGISEKGILFLVLFVFILLVFVIICNGKIG